MPYLLQSSFVCVCEGERTDMPNQKHKKKFIGHYWTHKSFAKCSLYTETNGVASVTINQLTNPFENNGSL